MFKAFPRWWGKRISTVSRHKRDPNSPVLAAAIAKRERRAAALGDSASRSWNNNAAHSGNRLNPFYINREA